MTVISGNSEERRQRWYGSPPKLAGADRKTIEQFLEFRGFNQPSEQYLVSDHDVRVYDAIE